MTHSGGDPFQFQPRTLLLGLASLWVMATSVGSVAQAHPRLAQVGAAELRQKAELESSEETLPQGRPNPAQASIDLERYVYENLFSIGFPDGWQVTEQTQAPQLTASSTANSPAIRTEVTWHGVPPQAIVPEAIQTIQANGYTVARYDAVNVDGTTALRIWLTDLPGGGLANSFTSFVGYQNATAVITSYYGDRSPDLDNLLSGIHQSFQRLSGTENP
ncbi:MAG TPA: hypothetical protein IGR64_09130 [Leptolyngbyaceae cyanobacterium M65_K2018_010]|nr:hypothetical protein [Leptolyngbyaceae cyanobacterium M65_K2018_010]